jgi:hypothetical protein
MFERFKKFKALAGIQKQLALYGLYVNCKVLWRDGTNDVLKVTGLTAGESRGKLMSFKSLQYFDPTSRSNFSTELAGIKAIDVLPYTHRELAAFKDYLAGLDTLRWKIKLYAREAEQQKTRILIHRDEMNRGWFITSRANFREPGGDNHFTVVLHRDREAGDGQHPMLYKVIDSRHGPTQWLELPIRQSDPYYQEQQERILECFANECTRSDGTAAFYFVEKIEKDERTIPWFKPTIAFTRRSRTGLVTKGFAYVGVDLSQGRILSYRPDRCQSMDMQRVTEIISQQLFVALGREDDIVVTDAILPTRKLYGDDYDSYVTAFLQRQVRDERLHLIDGVYLSNKLTPIQHARPARITSGHDVFDVQLLTVVESNGSSQEITDDDYKLIAKAVQNLFKHTRPVLLEIGSIYN